MVLFGVNTNYRHYAVVIVLFFFLNVYLLYSAQNTVQHVSHEKNIPDALLGEPLPSCEITDDLAKSAISRATSISCKSKLQLEACQLKNGNFTLEFSQSECSNHEEHLVDMRLGCFVDKKEARVLKEFEYKFPKSNRKAVCRKNCYKAGFLYYGLEFGQECFCGNDVTNATEIDGGECRSYTCPGADDEFCGGFNAVEIFRTGLKNKFAMRKPKYLPPSGSSLENPVKILFLLQLNGRNERQVKRFLKSIYLPHHYYYIHVDKRQEYIHSEMKQVAEKVPNIHITDRRFSTIWGGASLLQMFQQVIRDSMEIEKFKDWDYIFNFSESDFPILPIEDFERLITEHKGKSFLASHGYNTGKFIQKQGFEFVFSECDQRMFRIGRREFPENLRIDGGSDWVGIHRDLAEYSISDEELPKKLRKTFESVLLPLESFYHTLSFNSKFCDDLLMSNLRLTNWLRKQGCRCASLKKIVDWCGCSPLVFREDTKNKFDFQKAISKPTYFARKFDSMVDIDAIAAAELQSVSAARLQVNHPTYHFASANIFKAGIDQEKMHFRSLADFALSSSGISEKLKRVVRIDALRAHYNAQIEIVMRVETVGGGGSAEFLIHRKSHVDFSTNGLGLEVNGYLLRGVTYGTKFEWKEEICREYMGFVTEKDTLHTRLEWQPTERVKKNGDKTSPEMEFRYRNGDVLIEKTVVKPYDSVFGGQFDSWEVGKKLSNLTTCPHFFVDVLPISSTSSEPTPLATLRFPVYTEHNVQCHVDYLQDFFEIVDFCTSDAACSEKVWSTSYPDPKSDILVGYDHETRTLR